ncbi:MAG: NAD(P)/FAD-dependent oxidoreductase, partial [Ramlibacter sp.]|nr:NAD(P)/FAD-dependent oxidoreductase [Ramlibacter sp.]
MKRRTLLKSSGALAAFALQACAAQPVPTSAKVVVIGGGYGGATAAKYLRVLSGNTIDVTLIEPDAAFVSCPLSNLVIGGSLSMGDVTRSYAALGTRHGVKIVGDVVTKIDTTAKRAATARGGEFAYDKLIVSPGVDFRFEEVEGLAAAHESGDVLHAWKSGPEALELRKRLEAMPDGGVFAITIPEVPYRCPPAPYERACQVAWYLQRAKPRSKLLVLDANPEPASKAALFRDLWAKQYKGLIEYRAQQTLTSVDAKTRTLSFEVQDDVKADILNVIPPQRAGRIATQTGLANQAANRWVGVDFRTFESTAAKDVFVIGDSIQIAAGMPKSGHMANSHAKVAAAAIVAQLAGKE